MVWILLLVQLLQQQEVVPVDVILLVQPIMVVQVGQVVAGQVKLPPRAVLELLDKAMQAEQVLVLVIPVLAEVAVLVQLAVTDLQELVLPVVPEHPQVYLEQV
jgi:hypothetical protein